MLSQEHTPGPVPLEGLCRPGSPVDDLFLFDLTLLRGPFRPRGLAGLLVAVATAAAALRRRGPTWLARPPSGRRRNRAGIRSFPGLTGMDRNSEKSVVLFRQQDQPYKKKKNTNGAVGIKQLARTQPKSSAFDLESVVEDGNAGMEDAGICGGSTTGVSGVARPDRVRPRYIDLKA